MMMRLHLGNLFFCAGHPSGKCIIVNTSTGEILNTEVAAMHALIRKLIAGF
jgi:hypothetical protein